MDIVPWKEIFRKSIQFGEVAIHDIFYFNHINTFPLLIYYFFFYPILFRKKSITFFIIQAMSADFQRMLYKPYHICGKKWLVGFATKTDSSVTVYRTAGAPRTIRVCVYSLFDLIYPIAGKWHSFQLYAIQLLWFWRLSICLHFSKWKSSFGKKICLLCINILVYSQLRRYILHNLNCVYRWTGQCQLNIF